MCKRLSTLVLLWLMLIYGDCRCGERLERALDLMQQRGNSARRRYDSDDADVVYRERLRSAPIEVSLTKVLVEIPNPSSSSKPNGNSSGGSSSSSSSSLRDGMAWAKVERCSYEPSNNSIRTRVAFNELAVSGLVRLSAQEESGSPGRRFGGLPASLLPAESCRMSLRLRRAGMEFYTSPIARGRGQMRIRTESSFLEPRFASIYAYGCRPALVTGPKRLYDDFYDRLDLGQSEPRRPAIPAALGPNEYGNLASSNSTAPELLLLPDESLPSSVGTLAEDEDEENRLGGDGLGSSPNDALLDSLWRSRSDIAREMEDVFLRSASQAVTHYIERQLHPAIKETLMLSMGYTISYGR